MKNLAHKQDNTLVEQEYAHVIDKRGDRYLVDTSQGQIEAIQAVSCLIEPQVGDKILICYGVEGPAYILGILERDDKSDYTLVVPRNLTLYSPQGSVKLEARDNISLDSRGRMEFVSPHLSTSVGTAKLVFHKLLYVGQVIQANLTSIKTVAQVVESVAERFQQLVKTSYRTVQESEHFKAGAFHCLVDKLLSLKGKYTVIKAKTDVKINGKHIHMG